MCKREEAGTTEDVDALTKRQRALDARGNNPAATKRESSWATELARNPTPDQTRLLKAQFDRLVEWSPNGQFDRAYQGLGDQPTGLELSELMLDRDTSKFKDLVDNVALGVKMENPTLNDFGRDQPFFADRGRIEDRRMARRGSVTDRHAGITTTRDRSVSTTNVFSTPITHAKGQVIGDQSSKTWDRFQDAGAPFIGGASGTINLLIVEMESQKRLSDLEPNELADREKLLALHMANLVAGGHHSMSECLIAAQACGYFAPVPDPLEDYDASMKKLEEHLADLGVPVTGKSLSKEEEDADLSEDAVKYRDRRAGLQGLYDRYSGQFDNGPRLVAQRRFRDADQLSRRPDFRRAMAKLDSIEDLLKAQIAIIRANARGNNRILTGEQLIEKMGTRPWRGAKKSVAFKATRDALESYHSSLADLTGRKLDHDQTNLGIEELIGALERAKKGATDYVAKHATSTSKAARRQVMNEVMAAIDEEIRILKVVQGDADMATHAADISIGQAIEYARHGINVHEHAATGLLKEDRINTGDSVMSFGSGAVNTVSKLVYDIPTRPQEVRIFKPEPEKEILPGFARAMGIEANDSRCGKRNIASRKVCDQLGLGNMIPESHFTTHNGNAGLAMKMAPGKSLVTEDEVVVDNPGDVAVLGVAVYKLENGQELSENDVSDPFAYRDGTFYKTVKYGREIPLEVPHAPAGVVADVQKSLANLQWLDTFCGQTDRHPENYFVHVDGTTNAVTVTGIDNDFCFGSAQNDINNGFGSANYFGFPPLIDRDLYNTIDGLDWATYSADLGSLLSVQEMTAAQARFNQLKTAIATMRRENRIVDNWQTFNLNGQSATEIMMDPGNNTYYKRDVLAQRSFRADNRMAN